MLQTSFKKPKQTVTANKSKTANCVSSQPTQQTPLKCVSLLSFGKTARLANCSSAVWVIA
ncbi:hypothetical protein VEx25_B0084 [Vibrio antiquarius]|uniref:Uncharacterized protein n=1 Tax=Vibrio antiquarius (strain Ex25) TaxID=150340 RepID=A0ABM9WTY1_VIBAE|nr:hypothetical protein VEx25_B0084 [Vibrio antiquarius]